MNRRRTIWMLTACLALVSVTGPGSASAAPQQTEASWGVVPAQRAGEPPRPAFLLDLVPGVDVEDIAMIVNDGEEPLDVDIYAADGENLEDGSFALESSREPKDGMGAWIELPFTEAVVQPGKALPVPFTVHVPANAQVGDHSGGIVAIDAEASSVEEENGAAIGVKQGIGVRVHGRVAGPSQAGIEVLDVSVDADQSVGSLFGAPTTASVTYTLRNSGNLRITPTVEVEVGGLGLSASADDREIIDFLPGATATITEEVSGVWPTGRVTATVTATALDQNDSASSSALLMPWVLIALIIAGFTYLIRRRTRRRQPSPSGDNHKVSVGAALLVVLVMLATLGLTGGRALAAEPPTITLSTTKVAPGDVVGLRGDGWPAGELVHVVVCGNGALNGSADCAEQGYTLRAARADGTFMAQATLVRPPAPCPCVLKASSLSAGPVLAPIDMAGLPSAPPSSDSPGSPSIAGALQVVSAKVHDESSIASLFGASADATLELTVRNTSDVPLDSAVVARWGKGEDPGSAIASGGAQVFEPGETVTIELPFSVGPAALGGYEVVGQLTYGGGEVASFSAETSHWPWGIALVGLAIAQLVLLGLRNRARRRLARSQPPLHQIGELPPGPADDLPDDVAALVPVGSAVIDLDSPVSDVVPVVIDLDVTDEADHEVEFDPPAKAVLVAPRPVVVVPQVSAPVLALRTVQLAAHLRESTRTSLSEKDLAPEEVERRLLRSERTRRELAESLVLASAYRSDEMLDQRWNMAAPMPPARSPLALAPGRRSLTV